MMKITVKYFRAGLSGITILAGLGLSGCVPLPQAYAPPVAQQPYVQQQRPVAQVPQAAPLLPGQNPASSAQRYAALPVGRPQTQNTSVPPTLQPAQQQQRSATANNNTQQRYQPRPVTNTNRRQVAPSVAVTQQKPAPAATRTTTRPAKTKPVPVQTKPQKPAEVEVLEMKPRAPQKPVVEKKVPPPPPAPSYNGNPAVTILTKQANNQLVAGKTDRAASTLERALRIDPENPMLWLRLAEVNEKQGNSSQASSMAKKAMMLAPDDNNIKQRGRRLLN